MHSVKLTSADQWVCGNTLPSLHPARRASFSLRPFPSETSRMLPFLIWSQECRGSGVKVAPYLLQEVGSPPHLAAPWKSFSCDKISDYAVPQSWLHCPARYPTWMLQWECSNLDSATRLLDGGEVYAPAYCYLVARQSSYFFLESFALLLLAEGTS